MASKGFNLEVECDTRDVLAAVKKNRENHVKMVEEAKTGWFAAAEKHLRGKLAKVAEGKQVELYVNLPFPTSYVREYDNAITMLEYHQNDTITLSSADVSRLIQDDWDFSHQFLTVSSEYSSLSNQYAQERGVI